MQHSMLQKWLRIYKKNLAGKLYFTHHILLTLPQQIIIFLEAYRIILKDCGLLQEERLKRS